MNERDFDDPEESSIIADPGYAALVRPPGPSSPVRDFLDLADELRDPEYRELARWILERHDRRFGAAEHAELLRVELQATLGYLDLCRQHRIKPHRKADLYMRHRPAAQLLERR